MNDEAFILLREDDGELFELLDADGEDGLTFRALATRLETGAGAIYWHVKNKDELLQAASDFVVARAMSAVKGSRSPHEAVRKIAMGVFDAIDQRPWVGAQLALAPWKPATLRIYERLGREIETLARSPRAQFRAASTLLSYVIGESVQNAVNSVRSAPTTDRDSFLEKVSAEWKALDPAEYPFTRRAADQLAKHDDREEFLAGIDIILAGIQEHHA